MNTTTEIIVRWNDCDPMGHANNAVYFTYFEQARVALFREFFGIKEGKPVLASHFPFIIAEISCKFLKPVHVDERLIVETRVTQVKNSSFIVEYDMIYKQNGEQVATGSSTLVWYDYKTGKSAPIPEEYRKKLTS
ncbi:MAG: acyl-CoA thioesterase [Deltaproteobacteria bacterium]|nr:acyl-CoA thioesterase [Deltaproteobacteria bacterium]